MPGRTFSTAFGFKNGRFGKTTKFRRGAGAGFTRSGARIIPGRYAGAYRRTGFYGRYNNYNRGGGPGSELKFHDTTWDVNPIPAVGTFVRTSLCLIAQNVGESGRIGRKCTIKKIQFRGRVRLNSFESVASPLPGDLVRFILYVDKQTNGAVATAAQLLDTDQVNSFSNLNNTRFRILWDKFININGHGITSEGAGLVSQAASGRYVQFYKRVNIPIEYNAAAGAIGEIRSNNIGMMVISAEARCQIDNSHFRLRFEG